MAPFYHKTPGNGTRVTTDCRLRLEIPKNATAIFWSWWIEVGRGNQTAKCAIAVSHMWKVKSFDIRYVDW